ncbi:TIGR02679 family protein [Embleya sp. NPDC020630]|uniref:TIGR02679 family protein n=1 Tax=Embleya sp. NPDC020630 TaxID=3363979 RepID=UPI0037AA1F59
MSGTHLERLLGGPDLAWLVDRARHRLEHARDLDGSVTLKAPTAGQRVAVERLLGRPARSGGSLSVALPAVDRILRASGACPEGLAAAVEILVGPVVPRHEVASAERGAWAHAFEPLDELVVRRPELAGWAADIRASGLVRRVCGGPEAAHRTLTDVAAVLGELPVEGEPIGVFAARVRADAHALDEDRSLTTLVFGAARVLGGIPAGSGAEWRRAVWAAVGLLKDDLSSTVLTLGLPGDDASPTGRALAILGAAGQPAVLTLRQLAGDPPAALPARAVVFVCENPAVVAAAAHGIGADCPPLVCVSGQPGTAAVRLLAALTADGAVVRAHGDFDWGGLRIVSGLAARVRVQPWRYRASDYLTAVAARPGTPLTGAPTTAAWDPELADAMRDVGRRVEEETVLDDLLADLRATGRTGLPS